MRRAILRKTRPKRRGFFTILITVLVVSLLLSLYVLDRYCKTIFPDSTYRNHIIFYLKHAIVERLIIFPITNVLFTRDENLTTTRLPVWEIQLSGRKLDALNRDLPASGRIYQTGTVIIDTIPYPARFRFRGHGFWHWRSKQKSWKIQLRGGRRYKGKREFNLVNPRTASTLIWPLTSYIAKSMGLKTPSLQHVHARLNGQYLGILYLVENFDHTFTVQSGLPEGALYEDEALGGPPYVKSWENIDDWNIRPPKSKQKHQAGANPEEKYERILSELLQCIQLGEDEEFISELTKLVNIDNYLRWWAHTCICLDYHQDWVHNNRLYLNPTSARLQRIPWDMTMKVVADPEEDIDFALTPLAERFLQLPAYVQARNRIIWEALTGPVGSAQQIEWLNETTDLIREDVYCDLNKDAVFSIFDVIKYIFLGKVTPSYYVFPVTNAMFEEDVKRIRTFINKRMAYLERILGQTDVELILCSPAPSEQLLPEHYRSLGQLNILVGGQAGVTVKEILVYGESSSLKKNQPVLFYGNDDNLIEKKCESMSNSETEGKDLYRFTLNELLLPGRERTPPFGPQQVRYPFTIASEQSDGLPALPQRVEVRGLHSFTNQEISFTATFSQNTDSAGAFPVGRFQMPPPAPREIVWQGLQEINTDVVIQKNEVLIIKPGARVEFSPGSSLMAYGKIMASGTTLKPIVFTRSPGAESWGVVALQGAGAHGSLFKQCIFEYGSEDKIDRVFYSGMLSLYNADATVTNCLFRHAQGDDALNTKFSETNVTHSTFIDNKADAYDVDFSVGLIEQNLFNNAGNDGIDCGTAHPVIKNNRILHCGDKGISVGERSRPLINSNLIANCAIGIAIKDQSEPEIANNEFRSNGVAVSAYQKKKVFGGAEAVIRESRFYNNKIVSKADEVSSVSLVDSIVDGGTVDEK